MKNSSPTVICRYRVRPGREREMEDLLSRHWPTLHRLGLTTDEPAMVFRGLPGRKPDEAGGGESAYVEIFSWKDESSAGVAHETPEVMAVWEPMGALCETMEFPHFRRLDLGAR